MTVTSARKDSGLRTHRNHHLHGLTISTVPPPENFEAYDQRSCIVFLNQYANFTIPAAQPKTVQTAEDNNSHQGSTWEGISDSQADNLLGTCQPGHCAISISDWPSFTLTAQNDYYMSCPRRSGGQCHCPRRSLRQLLFIVAAFLLQLGIIS
ncbi:hypothetical protein J6590_024512 [Homalodisca vitripennis]|nr:hypothetical protein J6590_024512 [Homalodisca vitripennis]